MQSITELPYKRVEQIGDATLYLGDCLDILPTLGKVDCVITSPPYDNLREYEGRLRWDESIWRDVINGLYSVVVDGGVVVWVVGDATINGSETGTSFNQALWAMECGFNLHDTMIWNKPNAMPQVDKSRFCQSFEYMFVWSKGKPKTADPLLVPTKNVGKTIKRISTNIDNINKKNRVDKTKPFKIANNVYDLFVGTRSHGHPAVFPEQLAHDHIMSWSKEGDAVLDPFMGSGTTGVACMNLGRRFIGIEIEEKYFDISCERIDQAQRQGRLFE